MECSAESCDDDLKNAAKEKGKPGGLELPFKLRALVWLLTLTSPTRVRRKDVRRFLRWLNPRVRPSFLEVLRGWEFANTMVWLQAFRLYREKDLDIHRSACSIYRALTLLRNVRDGFMGFRVFIDILEVKGRRFENRDWTFFDVRKGMIFDGPVARLITTLLQFSDFDLSVYDDCGRFFSGLRGELSLEGRGGELYNAICKGGRALMNFRGHRKHLVARLSTYLHNLGLYSIGITDEKTLVLLKKAKAEVDAVGGMEPAEDNVRKIKRKLLWAFLHANDGSARIYRARSKMVGAVAPASAAPAPTRTEVVRQILPGVDPAKLKDLLRDIYERGFRAGEAEGYKSGVTAAFEQINVKSVLLAGLSDAKTEILSKLKSSVREGVDESVVGKINTSGEQPITQRSAARLLGVNRITIGRWIRYCETKGEEGTKCPVENFSPLLLESRTAFEQWAPTYTQWKSVNAKNRKKTEPRSHSAAAKQDHDDIQDMFSGLSRGM